MVYPVSPAALAALAAGHDYALTVTVTRYDRPVADIPVADGTLQATAVDRAVKLVVDSVLTDSGLLDPVTDSVVVRSGVAGVVTVPLFVGRVDTVAEDIGPGKVAVDCVSHAVELARDRFETPYSLLPGNSMVAEIARLVERTNQAWGVDISAASTTVAAPSLVFEDDPQRAAGDMAAALSCSFTPDRVGGFTLVPSKFTTGYVLAPVMTLSDDGTYGTQVNTVQVTRSRQKAVNSVTVVANRTDNASPVSATARDTDPSSRTQYGGPFGRQGTLVKIQTPLDTVGALLLAQRMLRAGTQLLRSWQVTLPHTPYLDPGDVVQLWTKSDWAWGVIESVTIALRDGLTTLALQEVVPQ